MENGYFENTTKQYQELRDNLLKSLEETGLKPMKPDGGYFIIATVDPTKVEGDYSTFLTTQVGVTSIPMGAFYHKDSQSSVQQYIRFAFCKDKETLVEASRRLNAYFNKG